jgi:hypothetical protein
LAFRAAREPDRLQFGFPRGARAERAADKAKRRREKLSLVV